MCEKKAEPDWPTVEDFVSSELPEGADDPYLRDHEAPSAWWDQPTPVRPKRD